MTLAQFGGLLVAIASFVGLIAFRTWQDRRQEASTRLDLPDTDAVQPLGGGQPTI